MLKKFTLLHVEYLQDILTPRSSDSFPDVQASGKSESSVLNVFKSCDNLVRAEFSFRRGRKIVCCTSQFCSIYYITAKVRSKRQ